MRVVLSIAGSDSSGGAGIQADLKTFEALGVFGTTATTVLTAQNTTGVLSIHTLDTEFIKAQVESILIDFDVSAIKIGMLYSNEIIDCVRDIIKNLNIPIVFDPVSISKSGSKLLSLDAIENLKSLFEYADVITPNLCEAKELLGYKFADNDSLNKIINLPCATLIKNHKLEINENIKSIDTLYTGRNRRVFTTEYVNGDFHGSGCSYSSAIASYLALGYPLEKAVEKSKEFIYLAITNSPNIGNGTKPLFHKKGVTE